MLLLGFSIDNEQLPMNSGVEQLLEKIREDLIPENLETAFSEDEWEQEGPAIRRKAELKPAPEGTVSFQLWTEMVKEVKELSSFYFKLLSTKTLSNTPGELFQVLKYLEVRLTKLLRVVTPRYTVAKVTNTNKNPQTHFVIRAYWFDNNGIEKRSVNKVYHKVEQSFKERFKTFFEEKGYVVLPEHKMKMKNGSIVHHDMVLTKGDKKLILELKEERCIKLFIRFSLWELYKQEYKS